MDVVGHCISAIADKTNCNRSFVKKCFIIARDNLEIKSNKDKCGRKKITIIYLELKENINEIIEQRPIY